MDKVALSTSITSQGPAAILYLGLWRKYPNNSQLTVPVSGHAEGHLNEKNRTFHSIQLQHLLSAYSMPLS